MHLSAYEEAWHEFGKVVLDVSTSPGTLGSEGKKHAMAMSDIYMVQRLEPQRQECLTRLSTDTMICQGPKFPPPFLSRNITVMRGPQLEKGCG